MSQSQLKLAFNVSFQYLPRANVVFSRFFLQLPKWKSWKFYKFSNLLQYSHTGFLPTRESRKLSQFLLQFPTHYLLSGQKFVTQSLASWFKLLPMIHFLWYIWKMPPSECHFNFIPPPPGQISPITFQWPLSASHQTTEKQKRCWTDTFQLTIQWVINKAGLIKML